MSILSIVTLGAIFSLVVSLKAEDYKEDEMQSGVGK